MLQWGRCSTAAESAARCGDRLGGHAGLQWGRCSTAAERWVTGSDFRGLPYGFNGAAARQQRRESAHGVRGVAAAQLQWGRCSDSSGEQGSRPAGVSPRRPASMGPLLDSSGELPAVLAPRSSLDRVLQWGRCSTAAERRRGRPRRVPLARASMGPLLDSSGEPPRAARRCACRLGTVASMGPLLDSSGERSLRARPESPTSGFNGAAARQQRRGWRRRRRRHRRRHRSASMGPLLDSSGERSRRGTGRTSSRRASMGPLLDSSGEATGRTATWRT